MQPRERAAASIETSAMRPHLNAAHVLNHMDSFLQDFKRPISSTTTPKSFPGIGPVAYDAQYTVVHDPPQWIGDGRQLRKPKVTQKQLQSQRELSNVVKQTKKIADSFMKVDLGLFGLHFDIGGSMPLIRQIAAGQRIAMRIYTHNEIKRRAADLKLVKLDACESLQRDVLNFMVDRHQPMTQAESNLFADIIFTSERKFDQNDRYWTESYKLSYVLRSEEIRRELSSLLWNLQFDRSFERTMSHLLQLDYGSWPKATTAPRHQQKRQHLDIINFCSVEGYLPVAIAASIVQGWNNLHHHASMALQGTLPVTQYIASTQNAYGAWEGSKDIIVALPPKPAFDQPLPYAPLTPKPEAPARALPPPPPPRSAGMMAGYWSHDNGSFNLDPIDQWDLDYFNPVSIADASRTYVTGDAPSSTDHC
ncbi:hypothetical protein DSL72_000367 [Monilinia vaccinii-corymbosi]|uniref:MvcIVH1_02417 n=1 Tax=Monilinia vaccinii-corymbosi TaxID=61207 RepID=A0A897PZP3_9HELO|nr:MvcIVH1_02417 [Monilinia vaccinii-corymbosi]QSZ30809.1 hypothetical protein DSL72_000367 [Monilinia vaccinii-corymbosi]